MRKIIFAHEKKACRIPVDPMNNTGAKNTVDAGKIPAAVIKKAVDQGMGLVTGSRMDHQSLWFIDHQKVIVLIDDIQVHLLSFHGEFLRLRYGYGNFISLLKPVIALYRLFINEDLSLFNEEL